MKFKKVELPVSLQQLVGALGDHKMLSAKCYVLGTEHYVLRNPELTHTYILFVFVHPVLPRKSEKSVKTGNIPVNPSKSRNILANPSNPKIRGGHLGRTALLGSAPWGVVPKAPKGVVPCTRPPKGNQAPPLWGGGIQPGRGLRRGGQPPHGPPYLIPIGVHSSWFYQ